VVRAGGAAVRKPSMRRPSAFLVLAALALAACELVVPVTPAPVDAFLAPLTGSTRMVEILGPVPPGAPPPMVPQPAPVALSDEEALLVEEAFRAGWQVTRVPVGVARRQYVHFDGTPPRTVWLIVYATDPATRCRQARCPSALVRVYDDQTGDWLADEFLFSGRLTAP
jgi:hypothetical protein